MTYGNVVARKQRGVRYNIFVMCAISNFVLNGDSAPSQVQVMDNEKCYHKLWLQSCINSLYDADINNDKLSLLCLENASAQVIYISWLVQSLVTSPGLAYSVQL